MRLVNLTMYKRSTLKKFFAFAAILASGAFTKISAQENSPFSRNGLGNQMPPTNIVNRAMGGVSAAYNDYFSVNYNNPASYSFFQASQELKSRKLNSGRAVLDIGIDGEARTLIDPAAEKSRFTTSNVYFSHVMVGIPLRKNWGMALGLRPVNRINYKIGSRSLAKDPNNNQSIDSLQTLYEGTGGTYLASLGTGVKVKLKENQYLAFGANGGYMFGKKDYTTRITPFNDTTVYQNGYVQNKTSYGNLYLDAGVQYQFKASSKIFVGIGAYGNWQQKLNATSDYVAGTYAYTAETGYVPRDTVKFTSTKGSLVLPTSYTAGIIVQKPILPGVDEGSWLVGVDFTQSAWDNYRYFGQKDNGVASNWQLKVGTELRPAPKKSYASNIAYRLGFHTGPDYLVANGKQVPSMGVSVGAGLPLANYNFAARGQITIINLAFEYEKRGSNATVLRENLYRVSLGFSLSDLWFGKRRYQ